MSDSAQDVDLVLAFLNTVDVEDGTDVLDEPREWRRWVDERGLGDAGSAPAVRQARDALRGAVTHVPERGARRGNPPPADRTEHGGQPAAAVRVRLVGGAPVLDADDALGQVLAAAVRLAISGEWPRIKICPADDCRWAFYDRSRNRSRSWCSMESCGNREKARQFRRRLRSGTPAARATAARATGARATGARATGARATGAASGTGGK